MVGFPVEIEPTTMTGATVVTSTAYRSAGAAVVLICLKVTAVSKEAGEATGKARVAVHGDVADATLTNLLLSLSDGFLGSRRLCFAIGCSTGSENGEPDVATEPHGYLNR